MPCKTSTALIRPIKIGDDKSKAPASFSSLAGAWLVLASFISIQLLPPASRIRLAQMVAVIGTATSGSTVTETAPTAVERNLVFPKLRVIIRNQIPFMSSPQDLNLNPDSSPVSLLNRNTE